MLFSEVLLITVLGSFITLVIGFGVRCAILKIYELFKEKFK